MEDFLPSNSCFYCRFFAHLNPDDDICMLYDSLTTVFCTCSDFEFNKEF